MVFLQGLHYFVIDFLATKSITGVIEDLGRLFDTICITIGLSKHD